MLLHRACWMDLRPAASRDLHRWALQVLFPLKAVRSEFAEPSMAFAFTSFHDGGTGLLSPGAAQIQTRWPTIPRWPKVADRKQHFLAWKRSISECLPVARVPVLEPSSRLEIHPEAGRILWLNDLKGGQEAPTRKTLRLLSSTRWIYVSEALNIITHGVSQENWISDINSWGFDSSLSHELGPTLKWWWFGIGWSKF